MDSLKCQTSTATPAEPGGLLFLLEQRRCKEITVAIPVVEAEQDKAIDRGVSGYTLRAINAVMRELTPPEWL